jgi:hypothetical protein
MLTHTTIRNFKCTHTGCCYSAKQHSTLKSHIMRKHDRTRRFMCPHRSCPYTAVHPGDLRSHTKRCKMMWAAAQSMADTLADTCPLVTPSEVELLPVLAEPGCEEQSSESDGACMTVACVAAPASSLPKRVTMPSEPEPETELAAEEVATMLSEMTATATATATVTVTASTAWTAGTASL